MDENYCPLWENGPLFRQAEHFRLSTDSVLLADFVNTDRATKGIDLGCASGIISLLLLSKKEGLHMTGLEIVPEAAELAVENMRRNSLEDRSAVLCGDIRKYKELFKTGQFDLVTANPPYFPIGSGAVSPDEKRAAARGETMCTMEDICTAAAYLCRTGGSVCMVHKPERLSELMDCMASRGIEPKRLRLVCNTADSAPSLVLVEGRRGGKPGLKIMPILVLRDPDGAETEEIKRIYRR